MSRILNVVRWVARLLSAIIILFWGFFIVAHLVGGGEPPARPLTARDYTGIVAMLGSLTGLAVAWRREFAGGGLALAAVALGATVNWRILLFPAILIPLNALLFLFCWKGSRRSRPSLTSLRDAAP
jgi:hypothetical protein